MRSLFFLAFGLLLVLCCGAQQTRQYSFTHYSTANGLSSNFVNGAVQDEDGFMWLITMNGLQRFDGNNFLTLRTRKDDPTSVPDNDLVHVYKDRKNRIWLMGRNNKIAIFNPRKMTCIQVPVRDRAKFDPNRNNYFFETADGKLMWHQNSGNLFLYDEGLGTFREANQTIPAPDGWQCDHIVWDGSIKKYWMICDKGLALFDPATGHQSYRNHNVDNDTIIKAFANDTLLFNGFVDADYNLFFCSWPTGWGGPAVYKYNRASHKAEQYLLGPAMHMGYHEVVGFFQQKNGRLWIYGLPFFAEWTNDKAPFVKVPNAYQNEQSIKYDYMVSVYEDRQKNLWLCTDNGLFLFNPDAQVFNAYYLNRPKDETLVEGEVQTVLETENLYYACSWGLGLFCYDKNFTPVPLPTSLQKMVGGYSIWDVLVHKPTGKLWFALQGGGLVIYDPKTGKADYLFPDVFNRRTIRQIVQDAEGNIWFATQAGRIIKWEYKASGGNPNKGYSLLYTTGIANKLLVVGNSLWIGTARNGLLCLNITTNTISRIFTQDGRKSEQLTSNAVADILNDHDTSVIAITNGINIINTRTNKVQQITNADGLPASTLVSCALDRNGILWIGMINGLCRVNLKKKAFTMYDRQDGIPYDKFSVAGAKLLQNGNMLFATDHNFLVFNPDQLLANDQPPQPIVTNFFIGEKAFNVDSILRLDKLSLAYNNNSITFGFSGLSFSKQKKLRYYYMLEGLDKDWIPADYWLQVTYNYLPSGEYRFKIKSENADGEMSSVFTSLPIIVRLPIWKSWWFYLLLVLLVIAVLYLIDRERMNKLRSLQQLRTQIAGNLHNEVSTTLNNINVLSEIAKIKADRNIEQSKDFIDQISDKSRHMMEALDDMLWSIQPENDSMKKTLLRINELTEGLKATYNAEIDLIVDHKVQALGLDMVLRHELFFFYKEAITYLVEHISCRQVFVNIKGNRTRLMLEILSECDTSTTEVKANFQHMLKRRVEALPGTVDMIADGKSFSVMLSINLS